MEVEGWGIKQRNRCDIRGAGHYRLAGLEAARIDGAAIGSAVNKSEWGLMERGGGEGSAGDAIAPPTSPPGAVSGSNGVGVSPNKTRATRC